MSNVEIDSLSNMHKRSNLLSLEQKRTFQLLNLMYLHNNNPQNLGVAPRVTRGADRDQFYVERYNNIKYKNSPFYKGAELWKLPYLGIVASIFQWIPCCRYISGLFCTPYLAILMSHHNIACSVGPSYLLFIICILPIIFTFYFMYFAHHIYFLLYVFSPSYLLFI